MALESDRVSVALDVWEAAKHAIYSAQGMMARQMDSRGFAPDSWGDDEHEAFNDLQRAAEKIEGRK